MQRTLTLTDAKRQYVHRFTMEHVPGWALHSRSDGTFYAPQYRSDAEWYASTIFPGEHPELCPARCKHCISRHQTWPLGDALKFPYRPAPRGWVFAETSVEA